MEILLKQNDDALKLGFLGLKTPEDLSALLEVPHNTLIYHLYRKSLISKYTAFTIPKASGGNREILAPNPSLKILQQKCNYILSLMYKPKFPTHGFVKNRSIVSNAKAHTRKAYVLNIDIEDFFPSINFGRVRGLFLSKPFLLPEKVSTFLAQLCCFNNQLPQGAPTSPIISNFISMKLDNELNQFSRRHRCSYTRYADDMTFSSKHHP